jgi:hypothetical protein
MVATAISASAPATATSASRSAPGNHDAPVLTAVTAEVSRREEFEYTPALPADVPEPALEVGPAFPCPPEALAAFPLPPPPRGDGARDEELPAALPGEEEEEEGEEGKGEGGEEEPPELPPAPPVGPLISVPPMIAWAPAPGPP